LLSRPAIYILLADLKKRLIKPIYTPAFYQHSINFAIGSDFCHFLELDGKDGRSCTKPCWRTPSFMNNCLPSTAIWRRAAARRTARIAAARCIRRTTAASRAADWRGSVKSTTDGLASVARSMAAVTGRRRLRCVCAGVALPTPIRQQRGIEPLAPQDRANAARPRLIDLAKDPKLVGARERPTAWPVGEFRRGRRWRRDGRVGTKDCSFAPLTGRVGDWRAGLGRSSCSLLARSFVYECHTISTLPRFQPPPRRTQHADFPHCALLLASPQGLWDLSCRSRFRRGSYNPIAPEEAQFVVHPLPTPPLPVEALTIPSALHMAPDLLFHPVFHEAEALAGMSDREVIHPST